MSFMRPLSRMFVKAPFAPRVETDPSGSGLLLLADWDNNGNFAGAYDNIGSDVLNPSGVRVERGRDQIRALAPPMAGALECDLDNRSKRYSPDNVSSPLYGKLKPGRRVKALYGHQGTVYPLFVASIDDLPQNPAWGERSAGISALGQMGRLVNSETLYTGLYQNIRTDEALTVLLEAAGISSGQRTLDIGKTILAWWWASGESAFEAAKKLLAAEGPGAALYEDAQGRIVFESRHYRFLTSRCLNSVGHLKAVPGAGEKWMSEPLAYDPGIKGVYNEAILTVKSLSIGEYKTIWEQAGSAYLAPNEIKQFRIVSGDPFLNALTPVAGEDYILVENSLASVSLDRASGTVATLTLKAGALGCTVRDLQVRAQPLETSRTVEVKNSVDAAASIADYGRRSYSQELLPGISETVAQDLANAIVYIYKDPRPTVEMRAIGNADAATQTLLLTLEISDRVTATEPQTGFEATPMFVERLEHTADRALFETTVGCEKATDYGFAKWDSAIWDTDKWGY